jgi:Kef-type K+ transport system membrane component KefB
LTESRLGVILTSAAMIDDVIGLIMVQVISNLGGGGGSSFNAVTVVRPIGVSLAFAVLTPLACTFIVRPVAHHFIQKSGSGSTISLVKFMRSKHGLFLLHTSALIGMVAASSYAGTSNLFAAYLAGVVVTWFDELGDKKATSEARSAGSSSQERITPKSGVESPQNDLASEPVADLQDNAQPTGSDQTEEHTANKRHPEQSSNLSSSTTPTNTPTKPKSTGTEIYDHYYSTVTSLILKPFFFASIGFSIPITQMFVGKVVWRGLVYATLMALGKFLCGLCLVRFDGVPRASLPGIPRSWRFPSLLLRRDCFPPARPPHRTGDTTTTAATAATATATASSARTTPTITPTAAPPREPAAPQNPAMPPQKKPLRTPKPLSLYPAGILGSAMIARGEIGFLVSSLAASNGIFDGDGDGGGGGKQPSSASSDLFLVVTWAILICTVLGPVAVGLLVKRVRALTQAAGRAGATGREDPLGAWGVVPGQG